MIHPLVLSYEERIGCSIEFLATQLKTIVEEVLPDVHIIARKKDEVTLRQKMRMKGAVDISEIDDIYGLRILVNSVEEIYIAYEKVSTYYSGFLDHDYVKEPKTNPSRPGKELRLLQFVGQKRSVTFEVQITTKQFDAVNEALHKEYHARKYG